MASESLADCDGARERRRTPTDADDQRARLDSGRRYLEVMLQGLHN